MRLVVHGHFYQPPRENPWTEQVPREVGAGPFHDWNERVTAESYRPNGAARVVDERGRVVSIVNNYAHLSFDLGPTLLAWLDQADPLTYERMLAGERSGGGGMAQSYGHLILPLASERDQRTQIRWGLADFERRFGRRAEGMWLPETAVNDAVLAVLVEEGVAFTILAPRQTSAAIVPGRPYRWVHPSGDGRGIDIVFYDGDLSHTIAFELAGLSSQALVATAGATGEATGEAVVIAADGETFGHHHKYGDRLIAYALAVEADLREVDVTTVADVVRDDDREREVVEVEESAWSCVHGVGRWKSDCGCSTGGQPGWNQAWRAPLRTALDIVKAHADDAFERRGKEVLRDPWAARDAYIEVVLGAVDPHEFLAVHGHDGADGVLALTLLEAQRHSMSMYTSCGWFFNDLAGIETVQVLCYAARVLDLLGEAGEDMTPTEQAFLQQLEEAVSNDPKEGNGRQVWQRSVLPAQVDAQRVAAHAALLDLLASADPADRSGGYELDVLAHQRERRGPLRLVTGRVKLVHRRTGRTHEHTYAGLHLGGLEVIGATNTADADLSSLRVAFADGAPITRLLGLLAEWGGRHFDLSSALPGGAEDILTEAADDLAQRFARAYERLLEDHRAMLESLAAAGYPLPPVLRAPAELALARRLETEIEAQGGALDPAAYQGALEVAEEARKAAVRISTPSTVTAAETLLLTAASAAAASAGSDEGAVGVAVGVLELARDLGLGIDIERAQELVYESLLGPGSTSAGLRALGTRLGLAVDALRPPS